jgi:hypothetical protein
MVAVDLHIVDLVDERPLAGARVTVTLTVVPRFPTRPEPDDPSPIVGLEADFRFAERLSKTVTVDEDGRFTVGFTDLTAFRRAAAAVRPELPREARDAVGFVEVGAEFLDIEFAEQFVAREIRRSDRVDATVRVDLGNSIVGHTTVSAARLWFHVPFQLGADHELTCTVVEHDVVADGIGNGLAIGRVVPISLGLEANTAVVDIDGLGGDRRHDYSLVVRHVPTGRSFPLVTGRFITPSGTQPGLSFAFGSCHLPVEFHPLADPVTSPNRSLSRWKRLAERRDYEFLLLTGDQIYGDGIKAKWPHDSSFQQFVNRYRQLWAYPPVRHVLQTSPTYMILDDHDIADDLGIDNLEDQHVVAGRKAYELFQHNHNPGPLDNGRNAGPLHYSFRWGPASFFVMDGRLSRGAGSGSRTFGRDQADDLRRWARDPETRAADIIFFVAPVPPALLPTELIRDLARELTEDAVTTIGALAGLALGGPAGSVVLGAVGHEVGEEVFERYIEHSLLLDADLGERWDLRENQNDLQFLLDLLFDLANGVGDDPPRKRAVFILSGDIHAGTMHLIRSLPIGAGSRHTANPVIHQLTSSAISKPPVDDQLWSDAVSKVDDDFDFDLRDLVTLKLASPLTDWKDVARRGIETTLGDGQGRYTLDPDLDRRFVCENTGLVMERTVGHVRVERRQPQRRVYRFHLAIEGESTSIESHFDLDLDADEVAPKLRDAEFVGRQGPANLEPLRRTDVAITMRNTGATAWTTGFALDITQEHWAIDRVPLTTTVRPGAEHTFRFQIVAPGSGSFPFTARMTAPGGQPFGEATPLTRLTARPGGGNGGPASCTDLHKELTQHQQSLRQLQAALGDASPAEKKMLTADIRRTRAAVTAVTQQMAAHGCDRS